MLKRSSTIRRLLHNIGSLTFGECRNIARMCAKGISMRFCILLLSPTWTFSTSIWSFAFWSSGAGLSGLLGLSAHHHRVSRLVAAGAQVQSTCALCGLAVGGQLAPVLQVVAPTNLSSSDSSCVLFELFWAALFGSGLALVLVLRSRRTWCSLWCMSRLVTWLAQLLVHW